MSKALRNFLLNIILYLLVGANIALVTLSPELTEGAHPGPGWHLHAILGILMTVGCLVHIVWHWRWFQAVLTGKARGKVRLVMISMITVMLLLASFSGHEAMTSVSSSGFHSFTGSLALIGLSIHGVKRIRWMALTARRLAAGNGTKNAIQSV
jgi:hypothetical protein